MSRPANTSTRSTLQAVLRLVVREYSKALLIVGVVVVLIAGVVLLVLWGLDAFNAGVYSLDGKSVQDATEEARAIRNANAGLRLGAWIVFGFAAFFAAAGAAGMWLNHRAKPVSADDAGDARMDDFLV